MKKLLIASCSLSLVCILSAVWTNYDTSESMKWGITGGILLVVAWIVGLMWSLE